ncbi:TPM domain-containing protein [Bradyrhizobium sp.]|uniref:TPM domain-containing protein n=1 Tax=Bradyrhizobium sp. TaxID=376 RepID=UPI0039C87B1D
MPKQEPKARRRFGLHSSCFLALLFASLICWPFAASAQVAVPPLTGRVVDQTATLSAGDTDALTQRLKDLERRKGSQVAVLIVPTTQPESIEQFSIRVAEAWKIGRKKIDDGALLVVAKNDRKLRIEVGYGLEGALPDVTARRIIDEIIVPHFRTGDFAGGISAGVDRIIRIIDGEPLPKPAPEASHSNTDMGLLFNIIFSPFGLIGYAAIAAMFRGLFGRLLGSGVTAGVVGAIFWFLLGSIDVSVFLAVVAFFVTLFGDAILSASQQASRSGRGSGGSWSSSGSSSGSWSSGSSSSDSGGFSGGGGDFGGGGASGSW